MEKQTYKWEVVGSWTYGQIEVIANGEVQANSKTHAKRLARKASSENGQVWGKKWKIGCHAHAVEGTQAWIGDNDNKPNNLLWIYIPKGQKQDGRPHIH